MLASAAARFVRTDAVVIRDVLATARVLAAGGEPGERQLLRAYDAVMRSHGIEPTVETYYYEVLARVIGERAADWDGIVEAVLQKGAPRRLACVFSRLRILRTALRGLLGGTRGGGDAERRLTWTGEGRFFGRDLEHSTGPLSGTSSRHMPISETLRSGFGLLAGEEMRRNNENNTGKYLGSSFRGQPTQIMNTVPQYQYEAEPINSPATNNMLETLSLANESLNRQQSSQTFRRRPVLAPGLQLADIDSTYQQMRTVTQYSLPQSPPRAVLHSIMPDINKIGDKTRKEFVATQVQDTRHDVPLSHIDRHRNSQGVDALRIFDEKFIGGSSSGTLYGDSFGQELTNRRNGRRVLTQNQLKTLRELQQRRKLCVQRKAYTIWLQYARRVQPPGKIIKNIEKSVYDWLWRYQSLGISNNSMDLNITRAGIHKTVQKRESNDTESNIYEDSQQIEHPGLYKELGILAVKFMFSMIGLLPSTSYVKRLVWPDPTVSLIESLLHSPMYSISIPPHLSIMSRYNSNISTLKPVAGSVSLRASSGYLTSRNMAKPLSGRTGLSGGSIGANMQDSLIGGKQNKDTVVDIGSRLSQIAILRYYLNSSTSLCRPIDYKRFLLAFVCYKIGIARVVFANLKELVLERRKQNNFADMCFASRYLHLWKAAAHKHSILVQLERKLRSRIKIYRLSTTFDQLREVYELVLRVKAILRKKNWYIQKYYLKVWQYNYRRNIRCNNVEVIVVTECRLNLQRKYLLKCLTCYRNLLAAKKYQERELRAFYVGNKEIVDKSPYTSSMSPTSRSPTSAQSPQLSPLTPVYDSRQDLSKISQWKSIQMIKDRYMKQPKYKIHMTPVIRFLLANPGSLRKIFAAWRLSTQKLAEQKNSMEQRLLADYFEKLSLAYKFKLLDSVIEIKRKQRENNIVADAYNCWKSRYGTMLKNEQVIMNAKEMDLLRKAFRKVKEVANRYFSYMMLLEKREQEKDVMLITMYFTEMLKRARITIKLNQTIKAVEALECKRIKQVYFKMFLENFKRSEKEKNILECINSQRAFILLRISFKALVEFGVTCKARREYAIEHYYELENSRIVDFLIKWRYEAVYRREKLRNARELIRFNVEAVMKNSFSGWRVATRQSIVEKHTMNKRLQGLKKWAFYRVLGMGRYKLNCHKKNIEIRAAHENMLKTQCFAALSKTYKERQNKNELGALIFRKNLCKYALALMVEALFLKKAARSISEREQKRIIKYMFERIIAWAHNDRKKLAIDETHKKIVMKNAYNLWRVHCKDRIVSRSISKLVHMRISKDMFYLWEKRACKREELRQLLVDYSKKMRTSVKMVMVLFASDSLMKLRRPYMQNSESVLLNAGSNGVNGYGQFGMSTLKLSDYSGTPSNKTQLTQVKSSQRYSYGSYGSSGNARDRHYDESEGSLASSTESTKSFKDTSYLYIDNETVTQRDKPFFRYVSPGQLAEHKVRFMIDGTNVLKEGVLQVLGVRNTWRSLVLSKFISRWYFNGRIKNTLSKLKEAADLFRANNLKLWAFRRFVKQASKKMLFAKADNYNRTRLLVTSYYDLKTEYVIRKQDTQISECIKAMRSVLMLHNGYHAWKNKALKDNMLANTASRKRIVNHFFTCAQSIFQNIEKMNIIAEKNLNRCIRRRALFAIGECYREQILFKYLSDKYLTKKRKLLNNWKKYVDNLDLKYYSLIQKAEVVQQKVAFKYWFECHKEYLALEFQRNALVSRVKNIIILWNVQTNERLQKQKTECSLMSMEDKWCAIERFAWRLSVKSHQQYLELQKQTFVLWMKMCVIMRQRKFGICKRAFVVILHAVNVVEGEKKMEITLRKQLDTLALSNCMTHWYNLVYTLKLEKERIMKENRLRKMEENIKLMRTESLKNKVYKAWVIKARKLARCETILHTDSCFRRKRDVFNTMKRMHAKSLRLKSAEAELSSRRHKVVASRCFTALVRKHRHLLRGEQKIAALHSGLVEYKAFCVMRAVGKGRTVRRAHDARAMAVVLALWRRKYRSDAKKAAALRYLMEKLLLSRAYLYVYNLFLERQRLRDERLRSLTYAVHKNKLSKVFVAWLRLTKERAASLERVDRIEALIRRNVERRLLLQAYATLVRRRRSAERLRRLERRVRARRERLVLRVLRRALETRERHRAHYEAADRYRRQSLLGKALFLLHVAHVNSRKYPRAGASPSE